MVSVSKIIVLIFVCLNFKLSFAEGDLLDALEERFQNKLSEYTNSAAKWLEQFNDRNLGNSEIGRMLRYNVLKPKLGTTSRAAKGMKNMGIALIPLVFHVGATSTWMLLTSIMAAKSVAIGLALLVFKIAVSSAKVAAFFTALKAKHSGHPHDWAPHYDHHGHERSLTDLDDWSSYMPESHASPPEYKTIPHKSHEVHYEESHAPPLHYKTTPYKSHEVHYEESHASPQHYKSIPYKSHHEEHYEELEFENDASAANGTNYVLH